MLDEAFEPSPATVTCKCGAVQLSFRDRTPVQRLLCGCCDCRQALAWASRQGGAAAPAMPREHAPLLDLLYLTNDVWPVRGGDKLRFFKLREDGRSTRGVATCCHSTLLVDHPGYGAQKVLLFPGACDVDAEPREVDALIYLGDLAPEQRAALPDFPNKGRKPPPARVALPRRGLSVEQLVAASGGVTQLGLEEGAA